MDIDRAVMITRSDGSAIEGKVARTFLARLRGLIGTGCGEMGDRALVFRRCPSIHTFGMRYPIDVAFVDAEGMVRKSVKRLLPNRVVSVRARMRRYGPYTALEREATAAPWFNAGEHVVLTLP